MIYKLIDLPGEATGVKIEINGEAVIRRASDADGLKYCIEHMGDDDTYQWIDDKGCIQAERTRSQLVEEVEKANTYLTDRGNEPYMAFEPSNWGEPGFAKNRNKRRGGNTIR